MYKFKDVNCTDSSVSLKGPEYTIIVSLHDLNLWLCEIFFISKCCLLTETETHFVDTWYFLINRIHTVNGERFTGLNFRGF